MFLQHAMENVAAVQSVVENASRINRNILCRATHRAVGWRYVHSAPISAASCCSAAAIAGSASSSPSSSNEGFKVRRATDIAHHVIVIGYNLTLLVETIVQVNTSTSRPISVYPSSRG